MIDLLVENNPLPIGDFIVFVEGFVPTILISSLSTCDIKKFINFIVREGCINF